MATRQARRTAASSRNGGYKPSGIGAKARAVASALSGQQFRSAGRHAAPDSYGSARKNATGGGSYTPQHGYNARHASGHETTGPATAGRHASWFRSR